MLSPRLLAPRGVYESCFFVAAVGVLVLFSVRSDGVLQRHRVVRNEDEYAAALADLTRDLDAHDPPPTLTLVD